MSQLCPINTTEPASVGFYIVRLKRHAKISAQSQEHALFYVCWPQHESSPTSINIYSRRSYSMQWEDPVHLTESRLTKLDEGNLLATWFQERLFLFITLSLGSTKPHIRTTIDIELKKIPNSDPAAGVILSSDPRRLDEDYAARNEESNTEELLEGGDELYGVPVRNLD